MDVYVLWHEHEITNDRSDAKIIGVYTSKDLAEEAILKYRNIDGFRDFPDGFTVDRYSLNKDHWTEGFVTI